MSKFVDIHTHIIPGVDDGAIDFSVAREMLEKEYRDGVRVIFATSHYRRGMFEPDRKLVDKHFKELKKLGLTIGEGILILSGCELHASMDMMADLKAGRAIPLEHTSCVLTEFSSQDGESYILERCYELRAHGYTPILAHVERCQTLRKKIDLLERLHDIGCLHQVNAQSILGKDGFFTKRFCEKLIEKDLIDFVGSDTHDMKKRAPMMGECAELLTRDYGEDYAKKLLNDNPRKYLFNRR